jgi:hypothetical protein
MISNMSGLEFKQFKRTYPGNYVINFSTCLSGINDFKTKNFSNFYLTNEWKISDVLNIDDSPTKTTNIFGKISFGSNYLRFSSIVSTPYATVGRYQEHYNYGIGKFTTNASNADNFTIAIFDNNLCNIYYTKNYNKYYLCLDIFNNLVFIKEGKFDIVDGTVNPHDFTYSFSEKSNEFLFFRKTEARSYILTKVGSLLKMKAVRANNIITYVNSPFKVGTSLYNYSNINLNTSFISYNADNSIDETDSLFDLSNNLLLHKKYSGGDENTNIIVLKNQLLQSDIFSSANNLLSANDIAVNGLREYTSIGQQIDDESSDSLELSYVFYNTPYKLTPGTTIFKSPSSMYPFTRININDTKFISSGAFSFSTPEYADKVYQISPDYNNSNNGQYLLCTWLSGSPFGTDKVWVDRYYYPDLISKENAISENNSISETYNDYIENMIRNNTTLSDDVKNRKFFDKRSDFVFEPNNYYKYSRIEKVTFPTLSSTFTYCSNSSETYPSNYFKQINEAGEISIGFNFLGDSSSWSVKSDRNLVDSGISFVKNGNVLTVSFNIYDYTSYELDNSSDSWYTQSIDLNIKDLKNNFVSMSINTKTGNGYIFFNDTIVRKFTIPIYQIYIKQLIYGDFYVYEGSNKYNLLGNKFNKIFNVYVNDYDLSPDLVFLLSLTDVNTINSIHVTLPCGMRNSIDDIRYIHGICGSSAFKSNNINISIKNLNIDNETILTDVENYVRSNLGNIIPPNTTIKSLQFDNYK